MTRFDGVPAWLLGQDGLSADGFSVVAPREAAANLREKLEGAVAACGGCPAGARAAEAFRILRGIPAPGRELTEARNPLEAGLNDAVSFDKGCYVGQEVVARLRTYDKISRALVGLSWPSGDALPESGSPLAIEGRSVGTLTSAVRRPGGNDAIGLGYIKRRDLRAGMGRRGPGCRRRTGDG